MIYTTKTEFIEALQSKFGDSIENIEESFAGTYNIDLKKGIDKGDFNNTIIQFTNECVAFDDHLTFWVDAYGDNFGTMASCLPFNFDLDEDYDEVDNMNFDLFEINLVGEILTVHPRLGGSFEIFNGDISLGTLTPPIKEDTQFGWTSTDLIAPDYAQQIGELIEEHEM